jgi:hypothetical protein
VGEQDHAFAFMGASDAEVAEPSGVAQCDLAVVVHAVGADPPVFALGCDGGGGFGGLRVGLGRCAAVQCLVRAFVVVDLPEFGQLFVQLLHGVGAGLPGEPFFQGLVEALDFALGLRVVRGAVLLCDAQSGNQVLEGVPAALSSGQAGGVNHAVVGQRRGRESVFVCC